MMKKYRPTLVQQDRELGRLISEKFTDGLMSNSKWKKLIDEIVININSFKRIEFKKISDDRIGILYIDENTTYDFDYWQNGFEGNNSLGGWLLFKEIEYLKFPAQFFADSSLMNQDLIETKKIIDRIGQYDLVEEPDCLVLLSYK